MHSIFICVNYVVFEMIIIIYYIVPNGSRYQLLNYNL